MNKPMFRAANLNRAERLAAHRRVRNGIGKRASTLAFLFAKNLLFWGAMLLSGFTLFSLAAWFL